MTHDRPSFSDAAKAQVQEPHALGLRAVIAYKAVKGVIQLALAVVLAGLVLSGHASVLGTLALSLRHEASPSWALHTANALAGFATVRHVELTAAALALDGALTLVEGWALHTRRVWAEWLVVAASGSLLPLELNGIVRHPSVGRVVVFIINLAIVTYLARRALQRMRAHAAGHRSAPPLLVSRVRKRPQPLHLRRARRFGHGESLRRELLAKHL